MCSKALCLLLLRCALKQEATSLEKAKREYDLWVLAEEYEEDR